MEGFGEGGFVHVLKNLRDEMLLAIRLTIAAFVTPNHPQVVLLPQALKALTQPEHAGGSKGGRRGL